MAQTCKLKNRAFVHFPNGWSANGGELILFLNLWARRLILDLCERIAKAMQPEIKLSEWLLASSMEAIAENSRNKL